MASQNISFDQIQSSIRKPGVYNEFNYKLAVRTLPTNRQRVLIAAQKTTAGTLPALTPIDIFNEDEAAKYFGRGSIGHRMVRAALKTYNYMALTILPMDDAGAGVAATATITFVGNATAIGITTVNCWGDLVEIASASGDTPTAQAAALVAQIAKQPDLPFTATNAAGIVTLTAKNKGTLGNAIKIDIKSTVTGTTITPVAFIGGATDPSLAAALAVAFAGGHTIIVSPYNDVTNLTALRTHLDNVSGPLEQRYCRAVCGFISTSATAIAVQTSLNARRISAILAPNANRAPYELAASYAAIRAFVEDPAQPFNGMNLTYMDATPLANRMSRAEIESCLYNGITPTEVGPGDKLQIVRAISTYTLNESGTPDISGLDVTTQDTLDFAAMAVVDRLKLRFPRAKKTSRTKQKVRSEVYDVLLKLQELEFIENVEANKDGILIEDDLQDPTGLAVRVPVDVVNGLHVVRMRMDLLL